MGKHLRDGKISENSDIIIFFLCLYKFAFILFVIYIDVISTIEIDEIISLLFFLHFIPTNIATETKEMIK